MNTPSPDRPAARGHEFEGRGPRCLKCGDSLWSHENPEPLAAWDHPLADVFENVRGDLYLFSIGKIDHATLVGGLLEAVALIEIDKGAGEAIRNA